MSNIGPTILYRERTRNEGAADAVMKIYGVPTALIIYAKNQREVNGKYAKHDGNANTSNPFLKNIATWIILKNINHSAGNIQHYRKQLPDLAAITKVSVRVLEQRINWMRSNQLAYVKDKALYLKSYEVLKTLYYINTRECLTKDQTISYDTTNNISLDEMFATLSMEHEKNINRKAYNKKVDNMHSDTKKKVCHFMVNLLHADKEKLMTDHEYFRQQHDELNCGIFQYGSPCRKVHDFVLYDIEANPDLNMRSETWAKRFGYLSASGWSYFKRKLWKKGLIDIEEYNVEGLQRARRDPKIYSIKWYRNNATTMWWRPDQISVCYDKIYCYETKKIEAA